LLNMRDFRALSGVSPCCENALQFGLWLPGKSIGLACFNCHGFFMPGRAIGQAKFRAYMLQTHP
jgi:hypothetical protein